MTYSCPQCGAVFSSEETCEDRFNLSQLTELNQPAYYAVHHLSVPGYMIQHNAYSRQGLIEVRTLLAKFVYAGWTPAMARREAAGHAASGNRTWSFTKGPKLPGMENIAWSFCIAQVRLDTAEHYCADVRRWAETILADTAQLFRELDSR